MVISSNRCGDSDTDLEKSQCVDPAFCIRSESRQFKGDW